MSSDKSQLYTQTEEFSKAAETLENLALDDLLRVLARLFGDVGIRSLSKRDLAVLQSILANHADTVASRVEGFYVRESSKQSQENSLNVLKAVLAGTAAATRDLTGEEPEPWLKDFVLDENAVEMKGNSVYIREIEDRAAAVRRIEESLHE